MYYFFCKVPDNVAVLIKAEKSIYDIINQKVPHLKGNGFSNVRDETFPKQESLIFFSTSYQHYEGHYDFLKNCKIEIVKESNVEDRTDLEIVLKINNIDELIDYVFLNHHTPIKNLTYIENDVIKVINNPYLTNN